MSERRAVQMLKDAGFIAAVLIGFLLIHGWTVEQDLRAQLEDQQRATALANARTASLMNGKGLYDKDSNTLYLTERVVEVPLGERE